MVFKEVELYWWLVLMWVKIVNLVVVVFGFGGGGYWLVVGYMIIGLIDDVVVLLCVVFG